jgi:hypothetical protein
MFVSLIVLACILGGIIFGMVLHSILPKHHLSDDTKDVVRLGTGLVGTIAALVLGLLIASAKSSYDAQSSQIRQMTANIILLDLVLAEYGEETTELRGLLRLGVVLLVDRIWDRANPPGVSAFRASSESEAAYKRIQALAPKNDAQRALQARALQIGTDLAQTRLLLFTQRSDAIPMPFLAVLVFWLAMIFASFTLFAKPSPTALCALVIFAVSATGAIYLILELTDPFAGVLRIPNEPLSNALAPLGRSGMGVGHLFG